MQLIRSTTTWLETLALPNTRVEVDLHGTPALYTARPGWRAEPRPFGQHLLYYVASGSFRFRAGKREETLRTGDLLWLAPWTPFLCWLPAGPPVTFYRFRLKVTNSRGHELAHRTAPLIARGLESARPWIEEIVRHHEGPGGRFQSWRLRGALLGLFADVLAPPPRPRTGSRLTPRQKEILAQALQAGFARPATPAQLAARLRLTPDYFARLFRRTYQMSPRTWIVRERVKMAAVRLLESQLGIGEVAAEFGYRDIFFFSRQFKQVMGRSPTRYRRAA